MTRPMDQDSSEDLIFEHEQNSGEDGEGGDGDEGPIDSQGCEANCMWFETIRVLCLTGLYCFRI
jgi:hypothetical protein